MSMSTLAKKVANLSIDTKYLICLIYYFDKLWAIRWLHFSDQFNRVNLIDNMIKIVINLLDFFTFSSGNTFLPSLSFSFVSLTTRRRNTNIEYSHTCLVRRVMSLNPLHLSWCVEDLNDFWFKENVLNLKI